MPLLILGVLSAGAFGGLIWWGNKRKREGASSGTTPFPTNEQGKTQT